MQDNKIVITGMGAITPVGLGVPAYWDALTHGVCGIAPITQWDASALPVRIAAEVKNFDPLQYMPKTIARTMSRLMQFSFAAAEEAWRNSALPQTITQNPERVGIVMATAMGSIQNIAETQTTFIQGRRVEPRFAVKALGNMSAAQLAIAHHIQGCNLTVSTACSSGGDAIMTAAMLLCTGEADVIVVVGGESILCPLTIAGLSRIHALSRPNDNPAYACRPFDKNRSGFVIGEGGGALILETERNARSREAPIQAVLSGWGNTSDAYHVTAPRPDGSSAAACMRRAIQRAGLRPEDIGYINAHGTATLLGDVAETRAVQAVFGQNAPPISSTKSMTGHLMGAGGLTEIIACIMALQTDVLPPTIHLETPDPDCPLDYIPNQARKVRINAALSNALGFGGQNSSILVTRYEK